MDLAQAAGDWARMNNGKRPVVPDASGSQNEMTRLHKYSFSSSLMEGGTSMAALTTIRRAEGRCAFEAPVGPMDTRAAPRWWGLSSIRGELTKELIEGQMAFNFESRWAQQIMAFTMVASWEWGRARGN